MDRSGNRKLATFLTRDGTASPVAVLALSVDGVEEHDLVEGFGSDARHVIESLQSSGELVRDGGRISVRLSTTDVHAALEKRPADLRAVVTFADRRRHGDPADPRKLYLLCNVIAIEDPGRAVGLLREHATARMAMPLGWLERLLRQIAAAHPHRAGAALGLLAREQLRWGDFEGARRTIDAVDVNTLDPEDRDRLHIMRAQAFVRSGQPIAAREALECVARGSKIGLAAELGLLELAILRGELVASRRSLVALAARTRAHPTIDARRMTALGLSYLFEERYELALGWARRARLAAARRSQLPPDPLTGVIDILAKLGLDRIDTAEAFLDANRREFPREPLGRGIATLYRAAVLWRRGDFNACLEVATSEVDEVDQLGDKVARAVIVRYLGRAALGLGDIERAERFFRTAAGIAHERGLEVLEPLADMDAALLAEHAGARDAAAHRAALALARMPRSPYARIEAWSFAAGDLEAPAWATTLPAATRAFAAMRAAERALANGAFDIARREIAIAESWYRNVGAQHELARSLVLDAELLARTQSDRDRLVTRLAEARALAETRRYVPLQIRAALVQAFIADRSGDIEAYVAAITLARDLAGEALSDAALAAAVRRVGLEPVPSRHAHAPWAAIITRLGLARPADAIARVGDAVFLLASDERPAIDIDLDVDVSTRVVTGAGGSADLAKQPLLVQILDVLASAGTRGCTLEHLYLTAWGASTYHELRQRNTIHVALNRLRKVMKPMVGHSGVEIYETRYRLSPSMRVLVRRSGNDWRAWIRK